MLGKRASRRTQWIVAALPLAFLASCGGSSGDKFFDGATAGSQSTAGKSNAQSGGAGKGGSATTGTGGIGMSGAMSTGASGAPASNGGAAIAGQSNPRGGSTIAAGGGDMAAGAETSAGGSDSDSADGGSGPSVAGGGSGPSVAGGGLGGGAGPATGGVGGDLITSGSGGTVPCAPVAERCDGLDNNCNGVADEGKACPTACHGFAIEGHGYMFCSTETGLGKGQLACEGQGLRLAWIETPEENKALVMTLTSLTKSDGQAPTLASVVQARIGATDSEAEGAWHWIDGSGFWSGTYAGKAVAGAYSNWSTLQPDDYMSSGQDCATLLIGKSGVSAAGEWDDVPCTALFASLCEVP